MHLAFVAECLYLTCSLFSAAGYLLPQVYLMVQGKLSYYFAAGNLLACEQESSQFNEVIDAVVDKYLASSRNYISSFQTFDIPCSYSRM